MSTDESEARRGVAAPRSGAKTPEVRAVPFEAEESGLEAMALRIAEGASETERMCSFLATGPPEINLGKLGGPIPIAGEFSIEVTPPMVVA